VISSVIALSGVAYMMGFGGGGGLSGDLLAFGMTLSMAVAMVVILGVAALAIDAASWYQKHHQAQVVADAAALAAANCLANPGVGSSGNICSSSTDVSDAQQVARNYAASNGVTIPTSNVVVNTSNDTVKVTASDTSPTFFASLIGIKSTTQTASSVASWTPGVSATCTTANQSAGQCWAVYAQNPTCGTSDGWVSTSASVTVNGAIHSQGSINLGSGGGGNWTLAGPTTYGGTGGGCYNKAANATVTGPTPTQGGSQASSYWPMDYSTSFPACTTTCTGPYGSPSYCTNAGNTSAGITLSSSNLPVAGHVYCSIGTGQASNPATWNGPIIINNGASAGSASSPMAITMIGGYVNAQGSTMYLTPEIGTCLIYALDADSAAGGTGYAVDAFSGNFYFNGGVFAPNGTINITSSATTVTASFLEAQNVVTSGLSFKGSGPLASAAGSSSTGSDALTQ